MHEAVRQLQTTFDRFRGSVQHLMGQPSESGDQVRPDMPTRALESALRLGLREAGAFTVVPQTERLLFAVSGGLKEAVSSNQQLLTAYSQKLLHVQSLATQLAQMRQAGMLLSTS